MPTALCVSVCGNLQGRFRFVCLAAGERTHATNDSFHPRHKRMIETFEFIWRLTDNTVAKFPCDSDITVES